MRSTDQRGSTVGRFLSVVAAGLAIVLLVMGSYITGPSAAGTLFTSTASAAVTNTAVETTLIGSGTGSLTLPAAFFTAGKSIRIVAAGIYTTDATPPTLNIKVKFGTTIIGQTTAEAPPVSQTDSWWRVDILITCRTTGATGTVIAQSAFEHSIDTAGVPTPGLFPIINTSTVTIDTTATQVVGLTATWSAAEMTASITGTNFAMAGYDAGTGGGGGTSLPSQTGNGGLFLQTDGSNPLWAAPVLTGAYASRPAAAAANTGQVYIPNDGNSLCRSTGAAWACFAPLYPIVEPVDPGTWVNQGGATISSAGGQLVLSAPASASDSLRQRVAAAPATPWTKKYAFACIGSNANFAQCGAMFRESGTGEIQSCAYGLENTTNTATFGASKWNSSTSFNSNYSIPAFKFLGGPMFWVEIGDDGVNRTCRVSVDGRNWISALSIGRTDFLTADQQGFYYNSGNNAAGMIIVYSLE